MLLTLQKKCLVCFHYNQDVLKIIMFFIILTVVVHIFIFISQLEDDKYQKCKIFHTNDSLYHNFFPIKKSSNMSNIVASVVFHVKAARDAHILLSPKSNPLENEPSYEIVLGGLGNTDSKIRRGQKIQSKVYIETNNIVSGDEFRGFWIQVKSPGLIMVGKEGEDLPFLHWQDPEPLPIKYYSFSSWNKVDTFWKHQCSPIAPTTPQILDQNQTEKEIILKSCRSTTFVYDYNYREFFPVIQVPNNKLKLVFYQKFFVKTVDNALMLLSQSKKVTENTPVYEIILGGGHNSWSGIRRAQRANVKVSKNTTNIVSRNEWKGFWIGIRSDGLIMVGREGEDLPFMHWKDPQPFKIKYYSLSSWTPETALWKHHCADFSIDKLEKSFDDSCEIFYAFPDNGFAMDFAEKPVGKVNVVFEYTFDVKSNNFVSVLLSSTAHPKKESLVYEIILGASNGSVSEIRVGKKSDLKAKVKKVMTDMPALKEWKKYSVQILHDGSIVDRKRGDESNLPLIWWKDPKPLKIKYYGFKPASESIALWKHKCSKQYQVIP